MINKDIEEEQLPDVTPLYTFLRSELFATNADACKIAFGSTAILGIVLLAMNTNFSDPVSSIFWLFLLFLALYFLVIKPLFWLSKKIQSALSPIFMDYNWIKIYPDSVHVSKNDHTGKQFIQKYPRTSFQGVCIVTNTLLDRLRIDKIVPAQADPSFRYYTASSLVLLTHDNKDNLYIPKKVKTLVKLHPSNILDKVSRGKYGLEKRAEFALELSSKIGLPYLGLYAVENAKYK